MRQSAIVGGAIVRHVYAADLFSISLRGPNGQTSKDDLTLRLSGVKSRLIDREADPPPFTSSLQHDGRGPCPKARDAAARFIKSGEVLVVIPNTGAGWLETLRIGAVVIGRLFIVKDGRRLSLADHLVEMGYCIDC